MMRTLASVSILVAVATAAPSRASLPIASFGADPNGPNASEFTTWGPVTNGLQVAIDGPAHGSFDSTKYFAALRNASRSSIYLCGIPWSTIYLTSSTGSTIPPTDSPSRSVFAGGFTDTLELRPNEVWVEPYGNTPRTSYTTMPPDAAGARDELEVNVGRKRFSSCASATRLKIESATLEITLGD